MKRIVVTVVAGLALTAGLAAPAFADGGTPTPSTSGSASPSYDPVKAQKLCKRVPTVTARVDKAITRIRGDVNTQGSVLWLRQQAAQAQKDGKPRAAAAYREAATLRNNRIPLLLERKRDLAQAATWCKSQGYTK